MLSGCASQSTNDRADVTTLPEISTQGTINNQTTQSSDSENQTINDLIGKEIPEPSGAAIKGSTFTVTGKKPDEIVSEYLKAVTDNGWKQVAAVGTKRFFEKEVNGKNVTISILSLQEGGPQEINIETVIQVEISSNPDERKKNK